ncbi:hypothetical protein [Streptomyces sp. NPDC057939]|uniref:hypothetical protein n=1 Tax=Streptomyces sp. NPDC057939 TaxID=3346284 RepID=UPI0036E4507E
MSSTEPDEEPAPRPPHHAVTDGRRARLLRPKVLALVGAVATALIITAVTTPLEEFIKRLFGIDQPEKTTLQLVPTEVDRQSPTQGWIAPNKTLPVGERDFITETIRQWQTNEEAVPAGRQVIFFTLQSSTPKTITIDSLEIQKECQDALVGPYFHYRGGGLVTSKMISVDLDSPVTTIVPADGDMGGDPERAPVTAFPFVVTDEEMVRFALIVKAKTRDCRWNGLLNWTADGHRGSTEISDKGKMLRLTGTSAMTENQPY